ncbi:MAG: accessory Sec system glycosyltransferase GtfB, partial [Streptococcus parasanguinis]|nr:accessory Sec system glycosyltransferase GtfB [Streptococcus parasanguinis]
QSLLDERGQAYLEFYLNQKQEEVLLHFVSEGTFLHQTAKGRDQVFANKEELLRTVLNHLLPEAKGVLLMDKDLLSFVERIDKERLAYCGNWSLDLAELTEHVGQLMVLDETLLPEKKEGLMELSGFVDLEGVSFQSQALIMTASQEVKGLSNLVDQFPQVTFHIAALTTMGPKLTDLAPCSNVRLYPGISMDQYEELLASCSLYLDCNQGKEVLSSSIRALENGQLLLGLQSTVHQEVYKKLTTVTETVEEMKVHLGEILAHPESFQERLKEQARILQLPKKEELRKRFECLEGGSHEHLYL